MSREQILNTLRSSLASRRTWLEHEAGRAPHTPPAYVLPPADDLATQFAEELGKLEGRVYLVSDDEDALEQIGTLLDERNATQINTWDLDAIGLPGLGELLQQRGITLLQGNIQGDERKPRLQNLEPAPVCISGADLAIAESGTLLLRHGAGRPR
ncbi:MAG: LUD domain-containing protein, partial [Oscillochloris sp.]|nr:LUD domain-containing protein [Oscillochloris sp.]